MHRRSNFILHQDSTFHNAIYLRLNGDCVLTVKTYFNLPEFIYDNQTTFYHYADEVRLNA